MAETPKLTEDLAALAEAERTRLGEPPTAELLLAYRDGELSEEEAERIRDRLAIDPEWASIYLDLLRSSEPGADAKEDRESGQETEVEQAWRAFSSRLDKDAKPTSHALEESSEARSHRRWTPLLLAATVALVAGLGLGWFLLERPEPPTGKLYIVELSGEAYRDTSPIPGDVDVIELRLDVGVLHDPPDRIRAEIIDSSGTLVWHAEQDVGAESRLAFRVESGLFELEGVYSLVLRPADLSSAPPLLEWPFERVPVQAKAAQENDDRCKILEVNVNLAGELFKQGDYQAAADLYPDVLDDTLASDCPLLAARAYNGLGTLASQKSRLIEALDRFEQGMESLEAAGASGDTQGLRATIEYNRGTAFLRLSRLEDARDAVIRLNAIQRRQGTAAIDLARTHLLSARTYRLLGDPTTAAEEVRQGLEGLGPGGPLEQAALHQEQARLDLDADNLRKAEEALGRALEALQGLEEPKARANVVVDFAELALRRGEWEECLRRADETLELGATGKPDLHLEAHARYLRSVALWRLGDVEAATIAADNALDMLAAHRGIWSDLGLHFFARRQDYARHRLDLAVAADDPEAAWSAFESTRARGLLDSLWMRPARSASVAELSTGEAEVQSSSRSLVGAIRELDGWVPGDGRERQEFLKGQIREHRRDLDQRVTEVAQAAGRNLPRILRPDEARALLDADTLGLIFASEVDKIHLLVLSPRDELELLTLPAERRRIAELSRELLHSLRPEVAEEILDRFEPIADELGRQLLAPLADRLDGFSRLVIVADEPLEGLPFEVLRDPRSGEPLIATHQISYLPSFSALGSLRSRTTTCPPVESVLLAMADPVFSSRDPRWPAGARDPRSDDEALALARLPETAAEARSIASWYPSFQPPLVGRDANRRRFLSEAPKHQMIHIASHARTDAEMPERSKIALSCVADEGRADAACDLYFSEIVNDLELCGQIVILSACNTAGGETLAGEGVLGLPRAFLRAGASAVVASHWRVPDGPTARLMIAFHRELREQADPAAALRQAKLERIDAGDPPSAWAAFTLLGDWLVEVPSSTFPTTSGPMNREAP